MDRPLKSSDRPSPACSPASRYAWHRGCRSASTFWTGIRPIVAAPLVGTLAVSLEQLEVGQNIGPAPARITQRRPIVEVARMAAHEDHGVYRAGATEHLASRPIAFAAVEGWVGLSLIHPVDAGIVERLAVADWYAQPDSPVIAARLKQQNPVSPAGGQPIGKDASCGPGSDDDIVILAIRCSHAIPPAGQSTGCGCAPVGPLYGNCKIAWRAVRSI